MLHAGHPVKFRLCHVRPGTAVPVAAHGRQLFCCQRNRVVV